MAVFVRMTEVRIMYVNAEANIGINPFFSLVIVPAFPAPRAAMGLINQIKVVMIVLTREDDQRM